MGVKGGTFPILPRMAFREQRRINTPYPRTRGISRGLLIPAGEQKMGKSHRPSWARWEMPSNPGVLTSRAPARGFGRFTKSERSGTS